MSKVKESLLNNIISVAYRDATITDYISVYFNALFIKNVRTLLKEYKYTARTVRNNILLEALDSLKFKSFNIDEKKQSITDKFFFLFYHLIYKNAYKTAATVFVILFLAASVMIVNPFKSHNYTNEEIVLAREQLGQSLAIVNKVFKYTGVNLDKNIFNAHVNKSLNKINTVNKILIGG